MRQDSYIKIEWAKDYFGASAKMEVHNDNVAQLCYYFQKTREVIAQAKAFGVGDISLPDDEYALLYEDDIAKSCCGGRNFRLFCMEYAAKIMAAKGYLNAFRYDVLHISNIGNIDKWEVHKTWPKGYEYCSVPCNRYLVPLWWQDCGEIPITLADFQNFKQCLLTWDSYKKYLGSLKISDLCDISKFAVNDFVPGVSQSCSNAPLYASKGIDSQLLEQQNNEQIQRIKDDFSDFAMRLISVLLFVMVLSLTILDREPHLLLWLFVIIFGLAAWLCFDATSIKEGLRKAQEYKDFIRDNVPVDNRDWKDKL